MFQGIILSFDGRLSFRRDFRIMQDERFCQLPLTARFVYLCMAAVADGKQVVKFSDSDFQRFGINRGTAYRRLKLLAAKGFIEKVGASGVYTLSRWQA